MRNSYQLECDMFVGLVRRALESNCCQLFLFGTHRSKDRYIEDHVRPLLDACHSLVWKSNPARLEFPNGSIVRFDVIDSNGDVCKFRGLTFRDIEMDEAIKSKEMWNRLKTLIRPSASKV